MNKKKPIRIVRKLNIGLNRSTKKFYKISYLINLGFSKIWNKLGDIFYGLKKLLIILITKIFGLLKTFWVTFKGSLSKWVKVFKYYLKNRRWTVGVFLISIFLSSFIVWKIYLIYTVPRQKTRISLTTVGSKYEFRYVEIYINYDPNGEDDISLFAELGLNPNYSEEADREDASKGIMKLKDYVFITTSPNLQLSNENNIKNGFKEYDCQDFALKCMYFEDSKEFGFHQSFKGNIFGHSNQGEFLLFDPEIAQNAAIKQVPMKIVVQNISELNLTKVIPEPKEKYPNGLTFTFDGKEEKLALPIVELTGVNHNKSISGQFESVILGITFGILASFIAAFVLEFIRHYEIDE